MKNISEQERVGCLGKKKHKSILGAEEAFKELIKFSKPSAKLNIYKCKFCKQYHIGNK